MPPNFGPHSWTLAILLLSFAQFGLSTNHNTHNPHRLLVGTLNPTSDTVVNTYTTNSQKSPAVVYSNGKVVIVWESYGQDTNGLGVFGQRFIGSNGNAAGSEFQANTHTTNDQENPAVATYNGGDNVVMWQSNGQDGSGYGVYGQRYNSAGTALGSEFQVNTFTTGDQKNPVVNPLGSGGSGGGFIVVYQSMGQDTSGYGIYARLYSSIGVAATAAEFKVNTYTSGEQSNPAIAYLSGGDVMIVWQSYGQDGSGFGIYGQRYTSAGATVGSEFQVNTFTTGDQINPALAWTSTGYMIVWQSYGQDGSDYGIYGQCFTLAGGTVGSEFRINTETLGEQSNPSVAMIGGGAMVVTWQSYGQDGSDFGIYAQALDSSFNLVGSEFLVNTVTLNEQSKPVIIAFSYVVVIVWQSLTTDYDIYAKNLCPFSNSGACVASCPAGSPYLYNQACYATCPAAAPNLYSVNKACYATCPSVAPYLFNSQCRAACPAGAPNIYANACYATCPAGAPNLYGNTCYTSCPAIAPNLYGTTCYITCPSVVPYSYNYQCLVACPTAAPNIYGNTCYTTCPAIAPNLYGNACYAICPTGAPYLYGDTCYTTCPIIAPNLYGNVCYITCPAVAPQVKNNICYLDDISSQLDAINSMDQTTRGLIVAGAAMNSGNSFYILLAHLGSMFSSIKYLRIGYPERVKQLFLAQDENLISLSINFELPENIEDNLAQRPLPDVFEKYDVHSSFFYNFWDPLITLSITLVSTFLVMLLEYITPKFPKIHAVVNKLLGITKWNLPLLLIYGNASETVFYASLELSTVEFDSAMSAVSFGVCLFIVTLSALVVIKTLVILVKIRGNKELKEKYKEYSIVFEEYEDRSFLAFGFLIIVCLRNTAFNLILTLAFDYPLIQCILIVCLSMFMLFYLATERPTKGKFELFQVFMNEVMLLVLNICVLILAVMDAQRQEMVETRDKIGQGIVMLYIIFSAFNFALLLIDLCKNFIIVYKIIKAVRARKPTSFAQMLRFIFQPGEEVLPVAISSPRKNANLPKTASSGMNPPQPIKQIETSNSKLNRNNNVRLKVIQTPWKQPIDMSPNNLDDTVQGNLIDLNGSSFLDGTMSRPKLHEASYISNSEPYKPKKQNKRDSSIVSQDRSFDINASATNSQSGVKILYVKKFR